MRRYFFHLQTYGVRSTDETGSLQPDTQAVVEEAVKAARSIMASGMKGLDDNSWRGWAIIVTDEVGQTILKVPLEMLNAHETKRREA